MTFSSTEYSAIQVILLGNRNISPSIQTFNEMVSDISLVDGYTDTSIAQIPDTEYISSETSSDVYDINPRVYQVVLAFILVLFCICIVFGNLLVMVAIAKQQYLHTVTNYFIASLATADCLVGAVVMPFSVIHEVMDKRWIFGREWCDVWHSLDVLASTASILNLCAISIDRYWAITDPMTYPSKMSPPRAKVIVALVWLCSALISFPAIAWWRAVSIEPYPEYQCLFTDDIGYLIFSSIISFYGPLSVMVFTYFRIYKAAVKQTKSLEIGMKHIRATNMPCKSMTLRIHRGGFSEPAIRDNEHHDGKKKKTKNDKREDQLLITEIQPSTSSESSPLPRSPENGMPTRFTSRHGKAFSLSKKLGKLTKERKAAKTLAIVMGVFILCWLPFFIVNVLFGICGTSCIAEPELVSSIVTWLGWLNSGMNPVIYACWSKDFRRAFRQLLCCCCKMKKKQYKLTATIKSKITSRYKSPNEEVFL